MKREILFRGIDADKHVYWIEGKLISDSCISVHYPKNELYTTYDVIPKTVSQYTGFKVRGKKLFEGDEIQFEYKDKIEPNGFGYCTGIVAFEKGCFVVKETGYNYKKNKVNPDPLYEWLENKCDIIGNIHNKYFRTPF
jgi:hypothetical protein